MNEACKVITGWDTRWSYVNVFEPRGIEGSRPSYSVSLIIPKDDTVTIEKIKAAIEAAFEEGKSILKGNSKIDPTMPEMGDPGYPLYDGDKKRDKDPAYANSYYLNAKNYNRAPGILDKNKEEIIDREEIYSGCYGRASISFFAYNKKSKGIGCCLHHLQKGRDGEPMGNYTRAIDDFADDGDDFLN